MLCQIKKTFYNACEYKVQEKHWSTRKLGANLHTFTNKPRPHLHAVGPKRLWERSVRFRVLLALCLGLRSRLQGVRLVLWALPLFGPWRPGEYSAPARGISILVTPAPVFVLGSVALKAVRLPGWRFCKCTVGWLLPGYGFVSVDLGHYVQVCCFEHQDSLTTDMVD